MINTTNMTNVVNMYEGMRYANEVLGDAWGVGILFGLFIILIGGLTSRGWPFLTSLPVASLITTIVGLMLTTLGIVGKTPMLVFVILTALSSILFFRGSD